MKGKPVIYIILTVISVCSMVLAIWLGDVHVPFPDVVKTLVQTLPGTGNTQDHTSIDESYRIIILNFRAPRVILGFLVGGALAVAGAVMQGFFRNPMADPYIIGISSGAALGGTIAITFGIRFSFMGFEAVPLLSFSGGIAITFAVYLISFKGGTVRPNVLLLTGIALGALVSGITSAIMMIVTQDLNRVLFWLMGGLYARGWGDLNTVIPYILAGYIVIFAASRELNAMLLGDEKAFHLGINVTRVRVLLLAMSALITSAAVSVSGIIGFVGLIVPHMMRIVIGPDHRHLLPASILAGGSLLVLSDLVARTLVAPMEIPVGVVTAFLGCPFFLFLLLRKNQ